MAQSTALESAALVDPYTNGDGAALTAAGYVAYGPFRWCAGVDTRDIDEAVGQRVIWIETEHFKIGSTLATYKLPVDRKEPKRIAAELERLQKKLPRVDPTKSKLDPWLRAHLYAQRLEEQYADFVKTFQLEHVPFGELMDGRETGTGPYLGMPLKFTVLLTETTPALARYLARWLDLPERGSHRTRLPGGSMFLGLSAEAVRGYGYPLDAALHCQLAADLAFNFVNGFRDCHNSTPLWFKVGLAHGSSRRIDERFTIYAKGTTLQFDDESWKWEPRLRGLVSHDMAAPFEEMVSWSDAEKLTSQQHMVLWSRVAYLLAFDQADLQTFLFEMTESLVPVPDVARPRFERDRYVKAFHAGFEREAKQLEASWKEWVLKTYAKK